MFFHPLTGGFAPRSPLPSTQSLLHPILFKAICPNPLSKLRLDAWFRRYSHFKFLEGRKKDRQVGQMMHFMFRSDKWYIYVQVGQMAGGTNGRSDKWRILCISPTNGRLAKWQVGQMTHSIYRSDKWQVGQMSRSDKCQVGQMSRSDKCQVGQMSVGQTSVGQTSVAQKSRHRLCGKAKQGKALFSAQTFIEHKPNWYHQVGGFLHPEKWSFTKKY